MVMGTIDSLYFFFVELDTKIESIVGHVGSTIVAVVFFRARFASLKMLYKWKEIALRVRLKWFLCSVSI